MTKCNNCGLTQDELDEDDINEIVVGPTGHGGSQCTVCRADELVEQTTLSKQEATVAAHKQISGASHETIKDRMDVEKSTVDEYSRRMKKKASTARRTADELSEYV